MSSRSEIARLDIGEAHVRIGMREAGNNDANVALQRIVNEPDIDEAYDTETDGVQIFYGNQINDTEADDFTDNAVHANDIETADDEMSVNGEHTQLSFPDYANSFRRYNPSSDKLFDCRRGAQTRWHALTALKGLQALLTALASIGTLQLKSHDFEYDAREEIKLDPSSDLEPLPSEILGQITDYLSEEDHKNFRLTSKRMSAVVAVHFGKAMVVNRTVFPTFSSVLHFLGLVRDNPELVRHVRSVTVVGEGLRMPEYGYDWAWDRVMEGEGVHGVLPTKKDRKLIEWANDEHAREVFTNGAFVNGGGYRIMLDMLFAHLPHLEVIYTRKLVPGEHVPGWKGPEALQHLSFFRQGLGVNDVWYGNWQYDLKHFRITVWIDEFGEEETEEDVGPQAAFEDDVEAARGKSAPGAFIIEMD